MLTKITDFCQPLLLQLFLSVVLCPSLVLANDWPQWQGPNRDGLSAETGLLKSWPEGGPPLIWLFRDCGKGYAGPAVAGGQVYILGSRDGKTFAIAMNTVRGKEIWSTELGPELTNHWGDGPRSTPTVDGNRVYVMTGQGTLAALRTGDGQLIWQKSMADLGGSTPGWGYCESVLIDGDAVLCTPGGEAGAVAALNKHTGALLWQSTENRGRGPIRIDCQNYCPDRTTIHSTSGKTADRALNQRRFFALGSLLAWLHGRRPHPDLSR